MARRRRVVRWRPFAHLQQPPRSNVCGQTCVAIVGCVSLETAVRICGRGRQATSEHDLRRGLADLGLQLGAFTPWARTNPLREDMPALLRVRYEWRPNGYHWIVMNSPEVHDPDHASVHTYDAYARHLRRVRGYITSWAPITIAK